MISSGMRAFSARSTAICMPVVVLPLRERPINAMWGETPGPLMTKSTGLSPASVRLTLPTFNRSSPAMPPVPASPGAAPRPLVSGR